MTQQLRVEANGNLRIPTAPRLTCARHVIAGRDHIAVFRLTNAPVVMLGDIRGMEQRGELAWHPVIAVQTTELPHVLTTWLRYGGRSRDMLPGALVIVREVLTLDPWNVERWPDQDGIMQEGASVARFYDEWRGTQRDSGERR